MSGEASSRDYPGAAIKTRTILLLFFCWIFLCLCLLRVIYVETKEKAIAELNTRQMIHARQAKSGIEAFFRSTAALIASIGKAHHVIDLDDAGRQGLDGKHGPADQ